MKTITFDETKWKLVPIEPTKEMIEAAPKCEPEADEDGWIKWEGGDCPANEIVVQVRFRGGSISSRREAGVWYWGRENTKHSGDIVAYRIVK